MEKKSPEELLHVMQDRFLTDAAKDQAKKLNEVWNNIWTVLNKGIADNRKLFGLLLALYKGEIHSIDSGEVLKIMSEYNKSEIIEKKTKELFEKLRGINAMAIASGIPQDELPW